MKGLIDIKTSDIQIKVLTTPPITRNVVCIEATSKYNAKVIRDRIVTNQKMANIVIRNIWYLENTATKAGTSKDTMKQLREIVDGYDIE